MTNDIDKSDIQGIVFSGYKKMPCASYFLLKITDAEKTAQWLSEQLTSGAISDGNHREGDHRLNIAFSAQGLSEFNDITDEDLQSFDYAFQKGMSTKRRSTILGDKNVSDWAWGGENTVHITLMAFSRTQELHSHYETTLNHQLTKGGMDIIEVLSARTNEKSEAGFVREHFGFADGISQPQIKGFPNSFKASLDNSVVPQVATGEFLLNYKNEYDKKTQIPSLSKNKEFGNNGTYLVFRQLKQNVSEFWNAADNAAKENEEDAEFIASKMVGRWPNGALVLPEDKTNPQSSVSNNFDFSADPDGFGCPMGSHIRRSNPRGVTLSEDPKKSFEISNRHRILRRGRSYGPTTEDNRTEDNIDRGLLFICLNANIERQFEFIQHSWVNNVKFASLYNEDDPLIGSKVAENKTFTIPEKPVRIRIKGFNPFVETRGGEYFFLPSMSALKVLAS